MTGEPSYIGLGTSDAGAAIAFYQELLGWQVSEMGGGGQAQTGTLSIGIHGGDAEKHFEIFFAVADLTTAMAKVQELRGGIVGEVNDNPGFGRWVECHDDQGVRFGLRQPA